jgi:bifunctional isochorismate lyase / aryl carrier protein
MSSKLSNISNKKETTTKHKRSDSMAIPAISSYKMPKENTIPKNKVSWEVDPNRAVLLVHDMQQYFLDYYQQDASPIPELIANIQSIKKRCSELGIPVVYTAQPY